jgi:hypothetical protein
MTKEEMIKIAMAELGKRSWEARKAKMGKNASKIMSKYGKMAKGKKKKLSTP